MKRLLAAVALAMLPLGALAQDLTLPANGQYRSGDYQVFEVFLCDGDHTGPDTECIVLDTHAGRTGDTSWPGIPLFAAVEIRTDDCTNKGIGRLVGRSTSGGTTEYVLSANLQIGSAVQHASIPTTHRFIRFDISTFGTVGACSDFEVVYRMFYSRVPGG